MGLPRAARGALLWAALAGGPAHGADAPPPDPCQPAREDAVLFDRTTQLLEDTLCGAARWLDGLFGEEGYSRGSTTDGRVELHSFHSEFFGTEFRARLNARVRLPALERRLSAFVGRDREDDVARDRTEGFGLQSLLSGLDEPLDWFAGLAYALPWSGRTQGDLRLGLRGVSDPQLFAQGRVRIHVYRDERHLVMLRPTPFWNTEDGTGFTLSLDLSRVLAPAWLVRWGSAGTITEESLGVDWRSALILYQDLGGQRALAYEAFVRGRSEHAEPLTEYGLRVLYRQPLFRERLFAQLLAGYSWPRVDPALARDGAYSVGLNLEIPLGGH